MQPEPVIYREEVIATPEEWARWDADQRRLEELIERALVRVGTTREEISRRLGLPRIAVRASR
jgi:hypothetical protein